MAVFQDRIAIMISASSAGAVAELDTLQREAKKTDGAFDTLGKKIGVTGSTIKAGLAAGAAALVGGGLVRFLQDSATAYSDAAKAAGELATATGGSVEEVSRLQAALQDSGVGAEQAAGLLTKFTTNAGKNLGALQDLGVELKKNKDGSTDFADAMVQTVDAIGRIGDASQRNQALVQFFGKQGAAAFQELQASGATLAETMQAIDTARVFGTDDVRAAMAYDDAVDSMNASFQTLQFTVGRAVVPVLSEVTDLFSGILSAATPLIGALAAIPAPVYLAVGAFAAWKKLNIGAAIGEAVTAFSNLLVPINNFDLLSGKVEKTAGSFDKLKASMAANAGNIAFAAIIAAFAAVEIANENFNKQLEEGAKRLQELQSQGVATAQAVGQVAAEMEKNANVAENYWAAVNNFNDEPKGLQRLIQMVPVVGTYMSALIDALRTGGADSDAYARGIQKIADEQGRFAATTADAEIKQRSLNDTVVAFLQNDPATAWADVATAAADAADAQQQQKDATRLAAQAMLPYADAAQKASFWTDELNRTIEDGITSGAQFEGVARKAAEAQYLQSQNTRLAEEALDRFNFTLGEVLDDLGRTDKWGAGVENLKASLDGLDFKQKADQWGDEWKIAAGSARESILAEMQRAVEETPTLDAQKWLEDLKTGAPPEVKKVIADLQAEIAANPLTVPTEVKTPTTDEIRQRIADINSALASTWNEQVVGPLKSEKAGLEEALAVKVPVSVSLTGVDGPDGAQTKLDLLAAPQTAELTVETGFTPDGYNDLKRRKDYLAQDVTSSVAINVTFSPDGYSALKARKDYLSQDRTANINIKVNGASAARATLDSLGRVRGSTAAVPVPQVGAAAVAPMAAPATVNWNLTINSTAGPDQDRRIVRAIDNYARHNGRPGTASVTA